MRGAGWGGGHRQNSVTLQRSHFNTDLENRDDVILVRSLRASLISFLKTPAGNHLLCHSLFVLEGVAAIPAQYNIKTIGNHASLVTYRQPIFWSDPLLVLTHPSPGVGGPLGKLRD